MQLKVKRFEYRIKVKDGFDCDLLKKEVEQLVEAMGHNLLDFSYKEDGFILPPVLQLV